MFGRAAGNSATEDSEQRISNCLSINVFICYFLLSPPTPTKKNLIIIKKKKSVLVLENYLLLTLCGGSENKGSIGNFGLTQSTPSYWKKIEVMVKEEKYI